MVSEDRRTLNITDCKQAVRQLMIWDHILKQEEYLVFGVNSNISRVTNQVISSTVIAMSLNYSYRKPMKNETETFAADTRKLN